jgi:15-hydroxyprostaglandin dehydrogenase (NAD)
MCFEIKNKVALISGGASGIGLNYAKVLLRNELRAVTLADISDECGATALQEIENEFGPNRATFVKTDVTNLKNYEEAFKKTIEIYKNLDIVINNAGILNDALWEKAQRKHSELSCNEAVVRTLDYSVNICQFFVL